MSMDRLNETTAQNNPHLLKVKDCKGKGIRSGLLTLALVGGVSYASLRVPSIGQLVPVHYHLLVVMGTALLSGYLTTAYVTRKCFINLKKETSLE